MEQIEIPDRSIHSFESVTRVGRERDRESTDDGIVCASIPPSITHLGSLLTRLSVTRAAIDRVQPEAARTRHTQAVDRHSCPRHAAASSLGLAAGDLLVANARLSGRQMAAYRS